MKLRKSCPFQFILYLHLDPKYYLMTGKMVKLLYELFRMLDVHDLDALNDVQFHHFLLHLTTLKSSEVSQVFEMMDVNKSGLIEFDEFYLLVCILVAQKDGETAQFINQHSRNIFDILDTDEDNGISTNEFEKYACLFNFHGATVKHIFQEFDVSGSDLLDFHEFRMFTMACIDKQQEIDESKHGYPHQSQHLQKRVNNTDVIKRSTGQDQHVDRNTKVSDQHGHEIPDNASTGSDISGISCL